MAERVLQFNATIPAGTPVATPTTVTLAVDNWDIQLIDLEVPPGPGGNMGFYLANNGRPWIPRVVGQYLIWDDQQQSFTPDGYPSGAGWAIVGYNTGKYDHAVTVRFHVNPPAQQAPSSAPVVVQFARHAAPPIYDPVVLREHPGHPRQSARDRQPASAARERPARHAIHDRFAPAERRNGHRGRQSGLVFRGGQLHRVYDDYRLPGPSAPNYSGTKHVALLVLRCF